MLQSERMKSEDAREELRVKLEELEKHNKILKEYSLLTQTQCTLNY